MAGRRRKKQKQHHDGVANGLGRGICGNEVIDHDGSVSASTDGRLKNEDVGVDKAPSLSSRTLTLKDLPTEVLEQILEPDYYGLKGFLSLRQISRLFCQIIDGMMSHSSVWLTRHDFSVKTKIGRLLVLSLRCTNSAKVYRGYAEGRFTFAEIRALTQIQLAASESSEWQEGRWVMRKGKQYNAKTFFDRFPWTTMETLNIFCEDHGYGRGPLQVYKEFPYLLNGIAKARNLKKLKIKNMNCSFINQSIADTLSTSLQHLHLTCCRYDPFLPICKQCVSHPYEKLFRSVPHISITIDMGPDMNSRLEPVLEQIAASVEHLSLKIIDYYGREPPFPTRNEDAPFVAFSHLKVLDIDMQNDIHQDYPPLQLRIEAPAIQKASLSSRALNWLRLSSSTLLSQVSHLRVNLAPPTERHWLRRPFTDKHMLSTVSQWSSLQTLDISWRDKGNRRRIPGNSFNELLGKVKKALHVPIKHINIDYDGILPSKGILDLVKSRKKLSLAGKAVPIQKVAVAPYAFTESAFTRLEELLQPPETLSAERVN